MRHTGIDMRHAADSAANPQPCWGPPRPRRHLHDGCQQQSGFSLVEVLVSLLILSLGLLGLAALQSNGMKATHSAYLRTQATQYAHDILDRMRANREAARAGEYNLTLTAAAPVCTSGTGDREDCDRAQWRADIANLPGGSGSIAYDAGTQFVTIVVQWNDERAGGSTTTSLTIQTQL